MRVDVRGSGGSPGVLDPFGIGRTALIGDDSEGKGMLFSVKRSFGALADVS